MRKQNKLIFFNNTIYGLEKDYGFTCDLYRPTESIDLPTGEITKTSAKFKIKKAVFFPNQLFRDYNYAALFGKDMQFGGILDATQRRVLINKKRLRKYGKDFAIATTDYLIFNHERYDIQKIDELQIADFWHLIIKQVEGQLRNEIHDRKAKDRLQILEEILIA